jgi:UDP-4-amino-4,6-dideoxy-N-acetyl-beta-L-altrosamine transaminase
MSDETFIPYGSQWIDDDDIEAMAEAMRSGWLTTGPRVNAFEDGLSALCQTDHAVAVNSGTAALHAAYFGAGLGPGDEIITSPLTFAATANAALYLGAKVRLVDVREDTGNLDPARIEAAITDRTRLIVPVDYAGHPADYDALREIADRRGLKIVADQAHSLGASYRGVPAQALPDLAAVSLHPVKPITTGEGGAILTRDAAMATRCRDFRSHGLVRDRDRLSDDHGPWYYEIQDQGFNYRLTDIQCALGTSQLGKLPGFIVRRQEIARRYDAAFSSVSALRTPTSHGHVSHGWHLYVIRVTGDPALRRPLFERMRAIGLGVQVHYVPVHHHPHFQGKVELADDLAVADDFYARCISLPMFPRMTDDQVSSVIERTRQAVSDVLGAHP